MSQFSGWVAQAVPGPAVCPLVHALLPRPWGGPHEPHPSSLLNHGGIIWASFQKKHTVT